MKIIPLFALTLLSLSSCSDLNPEEKEEPKTKNNSKVDAPPPPPELPRDGIKFSDVNTADALLSEENKKTVSGPAPAPKPIEGDNVINVSPPLPTPSLPDE